MCKTRLKIPKATRKKRKLVISLKKSVIYWWIFSGIRARVFSSQEPGSKRGGSFSTPHFGTIFQIWWSYLAIKIQIVKKRFDSFAPKSREILRQTRWKTKIQRFLHNSFISEIHWENSKTSMGPWLDGLHRIFELPNSTASTTIPKISYEFCSKYFGISLSDISNKFDLVQMLW